jgi:excisionase family DNA binding protein
MKHKHLHNRGKPELIAQAAVAHAFGVDPQTVHVWAKQGKLRYLRTPGGHFRYYRSEVEALGGILAEEDR